MNTKISNIELVKLYNDEYLQMMSDFRKVVQRFGAGTLGIEPLFNIFSPLLDNALAALESEKSSAYSPAVVAADLLRDNDYRVLYYVIRAFTFSSKPELNEAATQLMRILKDDDNPLRAGMDKETTLLNNIVSQLRKEPYTEYLVRLNATGLLETVAASNDEFVRLSTSRTEEKSAKVPGDVKAVRIKIDPVYRTIIGLINTTASGNTGPAELEEFIKLADTDVRHYKTIIAQRVTRRENKKKKE